jgi:predicted regulator of Ras-like GTPase activity (Roadblock/LC7/MglB family)
VPIDNLNVFEEDFWAINQRLNKLLVMTNASAALLIDKAGQLITCSGDTQAWDTTAFAALAGADFAATGQLAGLVGEKEFSTLHHQGERANIYVATIEARVILAVVFDQRTTLGLVRIRVNQAVADLTLMFRNIYRKLLGESSTDLLDGGQPSEGGPQDQRYF